MDEKQGLGPKEILSEASERLDELGDVLSRDGDLIQAAETAIGKWVNDVTNFRSTLKRVAGRVGDTAMSIREAQDGVRWVTESLDGLNDRMVRLETLAPKEMSVTDLMENTLLREGGLSVSFGPHSKGDPGSYIRICTEDGHHIAVQREGFEYDPDENTITFKMDVRDDILVRCDSVGNPVFLLKKQ